MSETDPELPDIEFYTLPDLSDLEFWDRLMAAGLHQPEPIATPNGHHAGGWDWVNLTDPAYALKPDPPAILDLLYHGKRHVISGPPESAKTLVAYLLLLEALRQGEGVAIIDFEMGPHAAVTLLRELGGTDDEIGAIHYTEPEGPPGEADVERMLGLGVGYCLIDAAVGAYGVQGLDDNSRKDVELFADKWTRPLWAHGVATIVIDHVVKNADNRGKFAIGSERKAGQADVHLGLEAIKTLTRGGSGLIRITVQKDRPGYLERPTACLIELTSDPDTHQIVHTFQHQEQPTSDSWQPTVLMGRVSHYLQQHTEAVSRTQIETNVKGKSAKHIRQAIDALVEGGYAAETPGPRNARNVSFIKEYTTPSDPVPPRLDGVIPPRPDAPPPSEGADGVTAADGDDPVGRGQGDDYDRLLEKYQDDLG